MKIHLPVRRQALMSTARRCSFASAPDLSLRLGSRLVAILAPLFIVPSGAATLTWQGGNATWTDAANPTQWNPNDEPDADDDAVLSSLNSIITLGSNNSVQSLTMSNGISLSTAGFDLSINGLLLLSDSGTDLTIDGSGSLVIVDSAVLSTGAEIILDGGRLMMVEETGTGLIDINPGTTLSGTGTVSLNDGVLAAATTLMTNDGTISASDSLFAGIPPEGTLAIHAADANARINLDGGGSTAVVNVFRNQTLDLDVAQLDPFSASLNLFQQSVFDSAIAWSIDAGAVVTVDNGAIPNPIIPPLSVPTGTGFIRGAAFTQSGGTITVTDTDGALQFDAPFSMTGGSLVNNGEVIFNATSTIGAAANFTMPTGSSSLTVNAGVVVNVDQADFNAGGLGVPTNVITIGSGCILDLDLGTGASDILGGTINLNGGELDVTTLDNNWEINGEVNLGAATGISQVNGEALTFTSVPVIVGDGAVLDVNAVHTWGTGSSLLIGSGATAELGNATFASPGTITGAGQLRCFFNSTFSGVTTIGVNQFDWDGTATVSTHTVNPGAQLTINSPLFDSDGDMDDAVILGGDGGSIVVNGPASWTMLNTLAANAADSGVATIGGTSRFILNTANGVLNVLGDTTINAPVTFGAGSTVNVSAPAVFTVDGNAIYSGGTIAGLGRFIPPAGTNNTVAASSLISMAGFDFDRGNWRVESGATLTVDVGDIEPLSPTNTFDSTITLESGSVSMNTGDPSFLMDGTLVMNNTSGTPPVWNGEVLEIGNDSGSRDADLVIGGSGTSRVLAQVTFKSDAEVIVSSGTTLELAAPAGGHRFNAGCGTTIQGELHLDAPGNEIEAGAVFGGAGRLVVPAGRTLTLADQSAVDVITENRGILALGDASAAQANLLGLVQTSTGRMLLDLRGSPASDNFDAMNVSGEVELAGELKMSMTNYTPVAGDTFTVISADGGVSGTFDTVSQPTGMPAGRSIVPVYSANSVLLEVIDVTSFGNWINGFTTLTNPANKLKSANPDGDGLNNLGEFALDGDPTSGVSSGKIVGKIAPVGGVDAMTLTIPVRSSTFTDFDDPAGGELVLENATEGLTYRIQATDDLAAFTLDATEVTGLDATAIQAGLPPLTPGWVYRTFRSPGPVADDSVEFMRVFISE